MKNILVSLLLFGGLAICGCGGSNNGVTEVPLSNETGYTPAQTAKMKGGSFVDRAEDAENADFELGYDEK